MARQQGLIDETYEDCMFECEIEQLNLMKSAKRRLEFQRRCFLFHKAYDRKPLCKNNIGSPDWPDDLKGSLTHKSGHNMLAYTSSPKINGVGIDLEDCRKIHQGLYPKIVCETELEILAKQKIPLQKAVAITFSAKEAIFKAIHPIGKVFFYFHDAQILEFGEKNLRLKILKETSDLTPSGFEIEVSYFDLSLEKNDYIWTLATV